jgi:hypothetical protein
MESGFAQTISRRTHDRILKAGLWNLGKGKATVHGRGYRHNDRGQLKSGDLFVSCKAEMSQILREKPATSPLDWTSAFETREQFFRYSVCTAGPATGRNAEM